MKRIRPEVLHPLLSRVEKPGRYIGGELNMIRKDPDKTDVSLCLAYPDTYEVGMPFQGFQELYHLVNGRERYTAERVYAPWTDMEAVIREEGVPLFSLENQRPLATFDAVGFTLQYEMTYTNILNMLDLAGIPLLAADRQDDSPLIIAGGSCVYNPEPLAPFIDVFVVGDAEDLILPFLELLDDAKNHRKTRKTLLETIASENPAYYVPRVWDKRPYPVQRHIVSELRPDYYPVKPFIPFIEIAHDRFALEVQRGCTEGCRFCQAGMIYRPVRERSPEDLYTQTVETLKHTGYEEMSLLSLSTSDYTGLEPAIHRLLPVTRSCNVSVSFPSLRLDSVNPELLDAAMKGRKSGLTFAPEAGTERLRRVINKNITDEQLFSAFKLALDKGWKTVKFYFMIGLPTETPEDLDGIIRLVQKLHDTSRSYGHVNIHVTLSSFIPKPATPFQWEGQPDPVTLQNRIDRVKQQLRRPGIKVMSRDPEYSMIENILACGGRDVGQALLNAWKNGAHFDAWTEHFRPERWFKAFEEAGIQTETFLQGFDPEKPLPWEHINTGVSREYLLKEREKAFQEEYTPDCREGCTGCGVCDFDIIRMKTVASKTVHSFCGNDLPETPSPLPDQTEERHVFRMEFSKTGLMRYIGHQDLFRLIHRALNLLRVPVRFSEGYNQRPRISMGYPVPMGFEALSEYADIIFNAPVEDLKEKLNSVFPPGLRILKVVEIPPGSPSVMKATRTLDYEAVFMNPLSASLEKRMEALDRQKQWPGVRSHPKKGKKTIDLKPLVKKYTLNKSRQSVKIRFAVQDSRTGRLNEFLHLLFENAIPPYEGRRISTGLSDTPADKNV